MKIAVLGAGFSGLTLAYALQKKGAEVEVFESAAMPGGLIQTSYNKVMVESAAHALLSSQDVEELFQDLGIEMVKAGYVSNSKWIFRNDKPSKWPLSFSETMKSLGIPKKPKAFETMADWTMRCFSSELNQYLVAPAFQGVYGAQTDKLSASLILNKSFKPKKGKVKGSVAPLNGMNDLTHKLANKLKIQYNSKETLESLKQKFDKVVIATGIGHSAQLLETEAPVLAKSLIEIPLVSLLSATISYVRPSKRVQGFGCLFPKSENFESLGVLFNSDIFPKRGKNSETWIFDGDFKEVSSQIILKKIMKDRKRLDASDIDVDFCEIHRWPHVLPLYGIELEKLLASDISKVSDQVYLTGNYLGAIGLAKILTYNNKLASRILGEQK